MNVSLTPALEDWVSRKVESGQYSTASEVIREALRLLQDHDQLREIRLAELKREIAIGLEQVERGELIEFDAERIKRLGREQLVREREQSTGRGELHKSG
jgi:antitoxin ParD1/3/4